MQSNLSFIYFISICLLPSLFPKAQGSLWKGRNDRKAGVFVFWTQQDIYACELRQHSQDLGTLEPDKTSVEGEGGHQVPPPAEELFLVNDSCWERKGQGFFFFLCLTF